MDGLGYRFRTTWRLPAPAADTFEVLRQVDAYPRWWPEVKEARHLEAERFEVLVRALLPYGLRLEMTRSVEDSASGILEVRLAGHLEGFARWTIREAAAGSVAMFEEDVVTTRAFMNVLGPVARPFFVANHRVMMRRGERGLRVYVAGFGRGRLIAGGPSPDGGG